MGDLSLNNLLKYMRETYLPCWYNNTLPLTISKVAEENREFRVTEKHIQALWNNQKYIQQELKDDRGNSIKVIKHGSWNREPGPDFKNAQVTINGKQLNGEIELHLHPELWNAHGHQYDPAYKNVILHIVWENPANTRIPSHIPVLELKNSLSVSADVIWELTDLSNYARNCIHPQAQCSETINRISDDDLTMVFRAAGLSRLQRKAAQFKLSVLKYGVQQALYLSLADSLGFKSNREQFKQLAQAAPLSKLSFLKDNSEREAYLWGISGLLPDVSQEQADNSLLPFTRNIWKKWWHLRENADTPVEWKRISQRPLNSPERRLAALILLLEKCSYDLESILSQVLEVLQKGGNLRSWFEEFFTLDSSWSSMCNFKTKLKTPCRLIGSSRQMDIIINVFMPALAHFGENCGLNEKIYEFYCSLPKCQDNHILDIARHRFFIPPSRMKYILRKAVDQQGMMQLMQDFDLPSAPDSIADFWEELGIPLYENSTVAS